MADYDNNFTGIISRNENKTDEKHSDIKGECEIDGVKYWIDGYARKRNSDGGKFYSLRFKPKQASQGKQAQKKPSAGFDDMPEDLPF